MHYVLTAMSSTEIEVQSAALSSIDGHLSSQSQWHAADAEAAHRLTAYCSGFPWYYISM